MTVRCILNDIFADINNAHTMCDIYHSKARKDFTTDDLDKNDHPDEDSIIWLTDSDVTANLVSFNKRNYEPARRRRRTCAVNGK